MMLGGSMADAGKALAMTTARHVMTMDLHMTTSSYDVAGKTGRDSKV
jgi:hypothetical protein